MDKEELNNNELELYIDRCYSNNKLHHIRAMKLYSNSKLDEVLGIIERSEDTEMYIKDFEKIKDLKDKV